jgi:CRP-like cAMP-binding protein
MQEIASVTSSVPFTAGSAVFPESAPPAVWIILTGELTLTGPSAPAPIRARSGDIVGSLQTLSGHMLGLSANATASGLALRITRDDLFDVLGERPELLRQMFAAMFRRVADPALASGVFRPKVTQSAVVTR